MLLKNSLGGSGLRSHHSWARSHRVQEGRWKRCSSRPGCPPGVERVLGDWEFLSFVWKHVEFFILLMRFVFGFHYGVIGGVCCFGRRRGPRARFGGSGVCYLPSCDGAICFISLLFIEVRWKDRIVFIFGLLPSGYFAMCWIVYYYGLRRCLLFLGRKVLRLVGMVQSTPGSLLCASVQVRMPLLRYSGTGVSSFMYGSLWWRGRSR